ncbi:MAG: hypothetical protein J7L46_07420 [Bacteroidales bacterium]|nr:hypothetical protein [Bacteroidales bacterium]
MDIAENSEGEIFFATSLGLLKTEESDEGSVDILQIPITGLNVTGIAISTGDIVCFSTNKGIWTLKDHVCKQIPGTENFSCTKLIADKQENLWGC